MKTKDTFIENRRATYAKTFNKIFIGSIIITEEKLRDWVLGKSKVNSPGSNITLIYYIYALCGIKITYFNFFFYIPQTDFNRFPLCLSYNKGSPQS